MGNAPTVDERRTFRPVRATGGAGDSAGERAGLVDRERLADMAYGSFLVVLRQLAGSALRPHRAAETGRSLAAGHKKEMSSVGKNQASARHVQSTYGAVHRRKSCPTRLTSMAPFRKCFSRFSGGVERTLPPRAADAKIRPGQGPQCPVFRSLSRRRTPLATSRPQAVRPGRKFQDITIQIRGKAAV